MGQHSLLVLRPGTPDNPWKPVPRPELPTFCSAIPRLIAQRHNIIEIVVVNGGGLYPSAVGLSFASTRAQRSAALQKVIATIVFKQLVELDPHTLIVEQTARLCIKYKTRNINVKFISTPDYLDDYDWSGELTADEVKPWLGNKIVQIKGPGLSENQAQPVPAECLREDKQEQTNEGGDERRKGM